MGGCRCSYRNCSVKSDGITHMFHYPVFEKIRCHQWLTNAHKLEFLNLKVSQLKNRVICQHHFKDECFMNYKKDKLTFHAVPTLDGPYCDSSQYNLNSSEVSKLYPISLDDIENEYLTFTDKKANFSVKYGDFLTNFDMMDVEDPMNYIKKTTQNETKKNPSQKLEPQSIDYNDVSQSKNKNESLVVYVDTLSELPVDNPQSLLRNQNTHDFDNCAGSPTLPIVIKNNNLNKSKNRGDSQIKILSETKISEPIKLQGKLQPVPPSLDIHLQENKNKTNIKRSKVIVSENKPNNIHVPVTRTSSHNAIKIQSKEELPSSQNQTMQVTDRFTEDRPKNKIEISIEGNRIASNSLLSKNKVNPERIAAIKEKRKFNMKLSEIIESCFDKIENPNENDNLKNNSKVQQHGNTKVGTFLSDELELPTLQEYTITCLEARLQKMENLLLSKINQNSQRIVELKNSINSSSKIPKSTQTVRNEILHKRQLYEEISQYLSSNVNSLIYEELFINASIEKSTQLNKKRKKKDIEKT